MKIDTDIMKLAMREHEVQAHGEAYGVDIPDDCLNDVAERYLRMSSPEPHKPNDPHHYEATCTICGQRGVIQVSLEPQRATPYAMTTEERAAEDMKNARRIADQWHDLEAEEKERRFQEEATQES